MYVSHTVNVQGQKQIWEIDAHLYKTIISAHIHG